MSSSSAISVPLERNTLDDFCSANKVSRVSMVELGFAVVLHQYFDFSEFTRAEAALTNHGDDTRYLITKSQRVQYTSELASTTSIRAAFGLGETVSLSAESLPLLVRRTESATQNGGELINSPTASLVFVNTVQTSIEALHSSFTGEHNGLDLVLYFNESSVSVYVFHNFDKVSEFVAKGFAEAFNTALRKMSSISLDTVVADVGICGAQSRATISQWNQHSTSVPNKLLHDLVGQGFHHKPDATAVLSWDGQLSYSDLDKRSSAIAAYLIEQYDLGPGKKVALCFEKGTWAIVSMLSVLKAGAAYCCLDPSHPRARHDSIIHTLDASLVIASAQYKNNFDEHSVLVPTLELASQQRDYQPTNVRPDDPCIVAFTSGSTGTPKGIVHTHNSLVTGILSNAPRQHLDKEGVSTFQWSSYTFDVSMVEIYAPLIYGGCICVPSNEERINNVEESMNRMAVNWAYFTPSFARLFAQFHIPSLQTLLLGGEVVTCDDINAWRDHVRVIHSYGPAECATFFLQEFDGPCPQIVPIGPAPNTYAWIVNPNNSELLSPLGAIGEMLYEGPGLLKEYLGNPEKTKEVLIDAPLWRRSLDAPAPSSKLYKSGDLVRYLPDGTMMYIGRKDTMIKLRGQRLEVGEVESVIRKTIDESSIGGVAVDLVELYGSGPRLVAFLEWLEDRDLDDDTGSNPSSRKLSALISLVRSRLVETVPAYMIPQIYIPLVKFPHTSNGKLDRVKLKEHVRSLPTSELLRYTQTGSGEEVMTDIPQDDTVAIEISEILLKTLSGSKLNGTDQTLKGKNATLENLGLDSLTIVSLVRSINDFYGLGIPVKSFRKTNMTVRDLAELVRRREQAVIQADDEADNILRDIQKLHEELAEIKLPEGAKNVVFLTGATGFLGTQILRQLLVHASVSKVIVLVRAKDAGAGLQRIIAAATTAGWWEPDQASRVEVWPGDLAKPQLGLPMEQWARLEGTCAPEAEAVTAIIHNGAVVSWASSYERLRATNVLSTMQILKLALAGSGPLKHCTYVSGGEMHFSEIGISDISSRLSSANGYSQSKFGSDVLVQRSMARAPAGRRINMVKPGSIIGTATEGICNTDDFIWRLAAGVCEAGGFVGGEQDAIISLAGADDVARTIIHACLGDRLKVDGTPEALEMTEGVSVNQFWRAVAEGTGLTLSAMDPDEWLRIVNENVSRKGSSHPLWPVMEFVEQRKGRIGNARSDLGLGQENETHVVECRQETLQALRKSVEYLSKMRFLQGDTALNNVDVFRRSRVNGT
ncbi:hypothetical protein EV127DRAFT_492848 [Xylaria flabelliformis]|nr:hypothetical protein EV127DRAFT_492848 [Xylaria flabelliformis]